MLYSSGDARLSIWQCLLVVVVPSGFIQESVPVLLKVCPNTNDLLLAHSSVQSLFRAHAATWLDGIHDKGLYHQRFRITKPRTNRTPLHPLPKILSIPVSGGSIPFPYTGEPVDARDHGYSSIVVKARQHQNLFIKRS
ncbi:hypothetical protein EDC04DRAFT_115912 [Pisolithus marmoratus]|nr:hypothetical protein EDC04DRAFT_115912 [Pisolithus marmoratus]